MTLGTRNVGFVKFPGAEKTVSQAKKPVADNPVHLDLVVGRNVLPRWGEATSSNKSTASLTYLAYNFGVVVITVSRDSTLAAWGGRVTKCSVLVLHKAS